MHVKIPALLHSYTGGTSKLDLDGETVAEVLSSLDQLYPGITFRFVDEHGNIRPHMKIYLNGKQVTKLSTSVLNSDEIFIIQALSGG
jgi:sulfur-carrier protein